MLKLSVQISSNPDDDELLFVRQLGVDYVFAWLSDEQSNVRYMRELKARISDSGLVLRNIGCMSIGKSDLIHLGLGGRDEKIKEFVHFIEALSQVGVGLTTFTWEPSNVWSSSPGESRGARARRVDMNELRVTPFTHGRRYTERELWKNFRHFLREILPVAESNGVKLALHPNDPPAEEIAGIPCLIRNMNAYTKAFDIADSDALGMEFCTGCWLEGGREGFGDILEGIKSFGEAGKILIVHFRNVSSPLPVFTETFLDNGYANMYPFMRALQSVGYDGTITMDHSPEFVNDPNGRMATAYAVGHMRALVQRAIDED